MKVFGWNELNQLSEFVKNSNFSRSALTIGGFDGPHIGHKTLFDEVLKKNNCLKGIVTFRFTDEFIKRKNDKNHCDRFFGILSTTSMKNEIFASLGFDFCLIIDFSEKFSKIKGIDFLKILREFCSMQFLAIGSDFRCGHNLDTGVAEISTYAKQVGLEFVVCNQVLYEERKISSSAIRSLIYDACFSKANELLIKPFALDVNGFDWQISEKVYSNSSDSDCYEIANSECFQVLPKEGVYNVKVFYADKENEFFRSFLYVESNFLRLEIPLEYSSVNPRKIIFMEN